MKNRDSWDVSESVLAMWTLGMVATQNICEEIEQFCNVSFTTSEQVVMKQGVCWRWEPHANHRNRDINKLIAWFRQHFPIPDREKLMSLSTWILWNDRINCYNAEEIGEIGIVMVIGKEFAPITFKRKDRVQPLTTMTSSIRLEGEAVPISSSTPSYFSRV